MKSIEICGTSYVGATRIIGGTEIVPHSEPWLVSLCMQKRYNLISFQIYDFIIRLNIKTHKSNLNLCFSSCGGCAGTLISQRHVISAAHCDQSMYLGYIK